jgi:hypothetical protein
MSNLCNLSTQLDELKTAAIAAATRVSIIMLMRVVYVLTLRDKFCAEIYHCDCLLA